MRTSRCRSRRRSRRCAGTSRTSTGSTAGGGPRQPDARLSGKGRFLIEPINLSRLVEEMGHLLASVISKRATVRYRLASELPPVLADATQLRQVVINLITNASDAIGEAEGVITIATGIVEIGPPEPGARSSAPPLPRGTYAFHRSRRHRHRDGLGDEVPHLRPLLHHEADGPRVGTGLGARDRPRAPRRDPGHQQPRAGRHLHGVAAGGARCAADRHRHPGKPAPGQIPADRRALDPAGGRRGARAPDGATHARGKRILRDLRRRRRRRGGDVPRIRPHT